MADLKDYNVIKKEVPAEVFSHEIWKIFDNSYFEQHLITTASVCKISAFITFFFRIDDSLMNGILELTVLAWRFWLWIESNLVGRNDLQHHLFSQGRYFPHIIFTGNIFSAQYTVKYMQIFWNTVYSEFFCLIIFILTWILNFLLLRRRCIFWCQTVYRNKK